MEYRIVELPATRARLASEAEIKASVLTLQGHPGFNWLLNRLRLQSAALKARLNHEKQATMDDVSFLQNGIFWTEWLDMEIKRLTTLMGPRQADPMDEELEAFKAIDALLERVGMEDEPQAQQ